MLKSKYVLDQLIHTHRAIAAGPSSPPRSLSGAPADRDEHGAAIAQQTAASLPASSTPGTTARPHVRRGVLATPLSGNRRPYHSETSHVHSPQRRRRMCSPGASGSTVSDDQLEWGRLITAYLR